jgi:hypothetical protein
MIGFFTRTPGAALSYDHYPISGTTTPADYAAMMALTHPTELKQWEDSGIALVWLLEWVTCPDKTLRDIPTLVITFPTSHGELAAGAYRISATDSTSNGINAVIDLVKERLLDLQTASDTLESFRHFLAGRHPDFRATVHESYPLTDHTGARFHFQFEDSRDHFDTPMDTGMRDFYLRYGFCRGVLVEDRIHDFTQSLAWRTRMSSREGVLQLLNEQEFWHIEGRMHSGLLYHFYALTEGGTSVIVVSLAPGGANVTIKIDNFVTALEEGQLTHRVWGNPSNGSSYTYSKEEIGLAPEAWVLVEGGLVDPLKLFGLSTDDTPDVSLPNGFND